LLKWRSFSIIPDTLAGLSLGGIQSITDGVIASFPKNVECRTGEEVLKIEKDENGFCVSTPKVDYYSDKVVYSGR